MVMVYFVLQRLLALLAGEASCVKHSTLLHNLLCRVHLWQYVATFRSSLQSLNPKTLHGPCHCTWGSPARPAPRWRPGPSRGPWWRPRTGACGTWHSTPAVQHSTVRSVQSAVQSAVLTSLSGPHTASARLDSRLLWHEAQPKHFLW